MHRKIITVSVVTMAFLLLSVSVASAHMVVKPSTVGIGSVQNFSLGVPTEKGGSTVAVRLLVPDGLDDVTPNVKPGWRIEVKKNGTGDNLPVTEIDWSGGSIPSGQRDEFLFSAQVPANTTILQWKAYQIYNDGSTVAWDQPPVNNAASPADDSTMKNGSYSTTQVVNDLTSNATGSVMANASSDKTVSYVAWAALAIALVSLVLAVKPMMKPKDTNI